MKKVKDNYVFTSKVNYKNNSNLSYQEVVVNKDYMIKSVTVLSKNESPAIKVTFDDIDMNEFPYKDKVVPEFYKEILI